MNHSLVDYLTMFGSSFLTVFLLGLQSKNVNMGRYVPAFFTSVGISMANFIFIKYVAAGSFMVFLVCASGSGCGIVSSIYFYKRLMERKQNGK